MESKQLVILGPPGAGVGSQAIALAEQWQVPCVSMAGLIRQAVLAGGETGRAISDCREKGEPIADEVLIRLLKKRFEQPDIMLKGWVLEGFPTSVAQAEDLDRLLSSFGLELSKAAYIKASTGILINRLSGESGESVSALRDRITGYKEQILPVMDYYQQASNTAGKGQATGNRFALINGSQSAAEVANALAQLGVEDNGAARFIDEAELDTLIESEPLLVVDCVASWCGPCKQVSPLIERLAETYCDRATVVKLDFDSNRQVAKRFKLKGMPSVMFFKQSELKETLTGAKHYLAYEKTTESLL